MREGGIFHPPCVFFFQNNSTTAYIRTSSLFQHHSGDQILQTIFILMHRLEWMTVKALEN